MATQTIVQSKIIRDVDLPSLRQTTQQYWTRERMDHATPIETKLSLPELPPAVRFQEWKQAGMMVQAPGRPPEGHKAPLPKKRLFEYSTEKVSDGSALPYCAVGKLFMTFGGTDYVGSAFVIAEHGVFTAGHCVYGDEGWADNLLFIPQYDDGDEPLGRWVATEMYSVNGWINDRDHAYDLGGFKVDRPIAPETGHLGYRANYPPNQDAYDAIGYPAELSSGYDFDGLHMWHCLGQYIGGSSIVCMQNNMTQGCSGGPWIAANTWEAAGLNSFLYVDEPERMYSPYFGEAFLTVLSKLK